MAVLTVQTIGSNTTPAPAAVSASDTFAMDPGSTYIIHIRNAGGSPDTVTITDPGTTLAGSAAQNPTLSVPATTGERYHRISPYLVNSSGVVTVAHSFTTSVTINVFRV